MDRVLRLKVEPAQLEKLVEFDIDECYFDALVEPFIKEFSRPGQLVLDPFAGSGTTLLLAERLGRRALGVEILSERVDFIRERSKDPGIVVQGDARELNRLGLPNVDFCMTSPPYMTNTDHPENPLTGYQTTDAEYPRYLQELSLVFHRLAGLLTPQARVVVNVANLRIDGKVTPLAFDMAAAISRVLEFEREIVIDWDNPPEWMINDYCLIFTRPRSRKAPPSPPR